MNIKFAKLSVSMFIFLLCLWGVNVIYQGQPHPQMSDVVVNISDVKTTNNRVRIEWECDNVQVTSYQIFRKSSKEQEFTCITAVAARQKYFVDTNLNKGNEYWYKIRAYNSNNSANQRASSFSSLVHVTW